MQEVKEIIEPLLSTVKGSITAAALDSKFDFQVFVVFEKCFVSSE